MSLPNVFQNKNINLNNNEQEFYYGRGEIKKEVSSSTPINIEKKLKNIFSSTNFVYKIKVFIKTKTEQFDTIIIGQTNQDLITFDNKLIHIKDIVDIYEI